MKQLSENDSKRVAQAWAEQYGASLLAEAEEMRRQEVSYQTPRADQAVRRISSRRGRAAGRRPTGRRRAAVLATVAAAACLVVVAWFAGIPSLLEPPSMGPSDAVVDPSTSTPPGEMIPISFDLPADYRVAATDYDNGTSLYTLKSATHGDVVLAMYHEGGQQADATQGDATQDDAAGGDATQGDGAGAGADGAAGGDAAATGAAEDGGALAAWDEVTIDGATVPAKIDEAYMLLTFEHEGLRYTLSSRDDMGALAALYRSIVRTTP
jgi:hypothetical protein